MSNEQTITFNHENRELASISPEGILRFKVAANDENAALFVECIEKFLYLRIKGVEVKTDGQCGATFELANGESVSPCHLDSGHSDNHQGFVLGSECQWPQGAVSE